MEESSAEKLMHRAEILAEMLIREVAHQGYSPQDVLVMTEIAQEMVRRVFLPHNVKVKYEISQMAKAVITAALDDGQLEQC